ncbi:MAG: hypothetical protein JWN27_4472 [Candidatus Eremiobacteraeota bacterium]|nr:hypothetical protein [Candidatus Eremiobacteraeota bacterium]
MSIDPLAAGVADLAALIDAELASLAADAQALRALLVVDAVVTARVLPSNGLTDLLEIAGRRVAASLPPTVRPGDALQVRVTGFDGERILLQIVATGAQAAVETGPAIVPLSPDPGLFAPAPLPPAGSSSQPQPAVPTPSSPPAATPTAPSAVTTAPPTPPGLGGSLGAVVSRASVAAPSGEPAAPRVDPLPRAVVAAGAPTSVEARLIAARATTAPGSAAPAPAAPELPAHFIAPAPPPIPAQRFVAPPQIAPKIVQGQNQNQNQNVAPAESLGRRPPASPPMASTAASANTYTGKTGLAAYAEPVALLRALRLLVTPSNVASATLALARPDHLPNALATLERALPGAAVEPHVATLRTLIAFVGRIDPRSPALAAQIAAYVEHVVDGAEPKLATLLAAARASESPALPGAAPNATANAASATAQPHSGAAADRPPANPSAAQATRHPAAPAPNSDAARTAAHEPRPPIPAAIVAERSAALSADLKQTMLVLASDPATPDALAPALAGAISALTAVQVSAAQTFAANPNGIAFTIPLATQNGPASARISVSRDAPQRGAKLDGENFRIAFVLDTAHFGTVAIDLVTVGRDVTVDVRAESAPAMRVFRDALGRLTERLESLRYRVASAGASVGITSTVGVEAPPAPAVDPNAVVDRSA